MQVSWEAVTGSIAIVSLLVGGATTYLRMFIKMSTETLRREILDEVEEKYMRKSY